MKIKHEIGYCRNSFNINISIDNASLGENVTEWKKDLGEYIVPKDLINSFIEIGLDAINFNEDYNDEKIVKQYLEFLNDEQKEIALNILCSELKVERKES